MQRINQLLLLGGHIQALGLARQAHRIGTHVRLCTNDCFAISRYSNCIEKSYIVRTSKDLLDFLISYESTNVMLFPTSDDYINFILQNYDLLASKFLLPFSSPDSINIFANKRTAYKYIFQLGIPQPQSWLPDSLEDIYSFAGELTYPIVVKPAIMYTFHKQFGKKAILCNDFDDLINTVQEISNANYPISELLLQEFLEGGAPTLFSYGTFAYEGVSKAWIIANRIRQNPMTFGNSTTFAITDYKKEIEESALKILKDLSYTGLAEIEFMYDNKTSQYKFLEINTRAWKWHTLSENFGWGFMSEMISFNNSLKSDFKEPKQKFAWVERLTDSVIIMKEILHHRMNLKDVWISYKLPKQNAVYDWKDLLPSIVYLLFSPILYFKRH